MKKAAFLFLLFTAACAKPKVTPTTVVTTFNEHGLDVSWDQSGSNRIAYSLKGTDGYYDIHLANPDGTGDTCLTCDNPRLPNKHIDNMSWHPGGKWLIFLAEKATHPGSSTDALPGFGAYCDIWMISADGTKVFQLVDIANDYDHGVIAPRFSPDGSHIVWTDRKTRPDPLNPIQTLGYWTIKTAEIGFDADSIPVVETIKTLEPGGTAFYECYGYSPDGSKLIFCSDINQVSTVNEHIYTMDTDGTNLTKLTDKDYNEHGFYTPDGASIVWMTNTQNSGGTDWWMMNTDGSNKHRLTYFNERNNVQYAGHSVWSGLGSFCPQGDRFIGGVQQSLVTQEGKIVMVKL